jgi:hypothetical protein
MGLFQAQGINNAGWLHESVETARLQGIKYIIDHGHVIKHRQAGDLVYGPGIGG